MLQGECPITLCPVNELSNPVSFSSAPGHIYELNSLCDWLECCSKNPLTGEAVCIRDLVTLGNADQQLQSRGIMERRVLTITHNQVSLMAEMQPLVKMETSEYKAFRNDIKEIKEDIEQLGERISEINRTTSVLIGEKARIENRIKYLNKKYLNRNEESTCCFCLIS